jgi:hypothetical protein
MPLTKYRSVADMPSPTWSDPLDPRNVRQACEVSALAARLHPRRFPAGLYKYRSVEEANRMRVEWELRRVAPSARPFSG